MKIIMRRSRFQEIDQPNSFARSHIYAGSEIMTHMHDNFALPLDAIHVLVMKKLFCAQHTYIQDHEIVLLLYRRSKLVVGTSRIAL
jgi:hypothetical protein